LLLYSIRCLSLRQNQSLMEVIVSHDTPAMPDTPDPTDPEDHPSTTVQEELWAGEPPSQQTARLVSVRPARRGGRRRKPAVRQDAPWPEMIMMVCLGALVTLAALSFALPFNTPVQNLDRAGLVISGVALLTILGSAVAAVGSWCHRKPQATLVCMVFVVCTVLNWCAWRFSFNIVEAIGSLF